MPDSPVGIYTFQRLKILSPDMDGDLKTFQQHMNRRIPQKETYFCTFMIHFKNN